MEVITKELIKQCRKEKKVIRKYKKVRYTHGLNFSLDILKMSLDQLEESLPENPEGVPAFMDYQEFYEKKSAEVYS